jgi:hypothetical protein
MNYKIEIGKKVYSFNESIKILTKMLNAKNDTWNKVTLIADKPKNTYLILFETKKKNQIVITNHILIPDGDFYLLRPENDYITNVAGAIEYFTNFYNGIENE